MTRPYRLGRRELGVEETRERVLAAAHDVFSEAGFFQASLDDVAVRAGVARATVYYQFKSKFGLLQATIANAVLRSRGIARMQQALESSDAAAGLAAYMKEIFSFWKQDFIFFRNVVGLAAVDQEAAQAVDQYDFARREQLVWLVKRLADQGRLRDGVSHRYALDTIWLLTSFRTFDHLHTRSGLSERRCVALVRGIAQCVLAEGAAAKPQRARR